MSTEITQAQAERVVERIKASGYGAKYAPPYGGGTPMLMVWEASGAETSLYLVNPAKDRLAAIVDALRAEGIVPPAAEASVSLTVNGLVEMAYGTANAAGWHDRKGEVLDTDHPYARIAVLAPIALRLADLIEAIRKPEKLSITEALGQLRFETKFLSDWELSQASALRTFIDLGKPAQGSKAEVITWLMLIISEAAEAIEAVIKGDKVNFAEELVADIPLRIGDLVGSINDTPGHPLGPIDPEATILAKNERNRARGYRHGGKQA